MTVDNNFFHELKQGFHIPPKPEILLQIEEVIEQPEFDMKDVSALIASDVGLSSDVLKVMNSSTFGMNRVIADISQAVCFLGVNEIRSLIATSKLRQSFEDQNVSINLERFWDESLDTANYMLFLNKKLGNKYPPDELYTLGMFHDCGIAVMAAKYDNYREILEIANKDSSLELSDTEEEMFGTNHAVVGYFIASSWHLPKKICSLILRHHENEILNENTDDETKSCFAILKVAENMVHGVKHFQASEKFERWSKHYFDILAIDDYEYQDWKDELFELAS